MRATSAGRPADLNGKRIAGPLGDASRQVFPLFASLNQSIQASIEWITKAPQLHETMLLRGQSDAIAGHVTIIMMNLREMNVPASDLNVMLYADHGVELYGHALITTPAFAQQNPQIVTDFIRATAHGLNVMVRDRDAALASVKKRDVLLNEETENACIQMSLEAMFLSPNVLITQQSPI